MRVREVEDIKMKMFLELFKMIGFFKLFWVLGIVVFWGCLYFRLDF